MKWRERWAKCPRSHSPVVGAHSDIAPHTTQASEPLGLGIVAMTPQTFLFELICRRHVSSGAHGDVTRCTDAHARTRRADGHAVLAQKDPKIETATHRKLSNCRPRLAHTPYRDNLSVGGGNNGKRRTWVRLAHANTFIAEERQGDAFQRRPQDLLSLPACRNEARTELLRVQSRRPH
jgi:hypothetical protein